jgi:TonB-linked SusC/RagA family outer membrane protein
MFMERNYRLKLPDLKKIPIKKVCFLILLLCIIPSFINAQAPKAITGSVVDDLGEPVIGANIKEKGVASNGTITDIDGKFSLSVSQGATLVVSYIGYVTQEIAVRNQSILKITLAEDSQALDEVVIIGYGTQKKVSLTGSVATMKSDDIRDVSTSNLSNALAGRLTGVTIKQSSGGRPGNTSEIVVRARGTWNNTSPLYVIDGVSKSADEFNLLNPGDIESLSVLKDASTSAIYGSRAANGVILVTTKKGQKGRPSITYSGSVSAATDFAVMPRRETASQRITWINDRRREVDVNPNSLTVPYNADGYRYWPTIYREDGSLIGAGVFSPDEEEYYKTHEYDIMDDAWHTPVTNAHSLTLSGGTDNISYFMAGNYYDETGAFKSLSNRKYSIRGNVQAEITHGLKAALLVSVNNMENSGPPGASTPGDEADAIIENLFYQLLSASRMAPAKVDGKYIGPGNNLTGTNVLAVFDGAGGMGKYLYRNSDYTAILEWDVPWVKGLNLKASFNQLLINKFEKTWTTPYTAHQLRVEGANSHIITREFNGSSVLLGGTKPSLSEMHKHSSEYQLNGIVSYYNTFAKKHELGLMFGFEQSEKFEEAFDAWMTDFELSKPYFMFGPSDKNFYGINGSGSESARLSYFGRLNYAFDSRYLFEFSFRRDASVKFDPKYRWGFFPSASVAWRISEESFFKDHISFINQLKLRSSYGLTGNDDVGSWQWLDGVNRDGGMYYGGTATGGGVSIGSISNPRITWEKSRSFDAGLDVGILGNMFTLGGNYFFRHTYDILGSQTGNLPSTFGGSLADSNYGVVNSFGIEVELGFNKQLTKDISIWTRGNFGWADNRLIEWAETGVPPHLSRIGKNWDRAYGWDTDGIIWDMTPNGDGTYNITTSTGGKYVVNHDYATGRGATYDIEAQSSVAMRPGFIFMRDIGSQQSDEEGNTVYSSTPDGIINEGFADKAWIVDHINPPYNYGLLLGGGWKGLSLEVFLQGTAGNMACVNHPFSSNGDWFGSSLGYWSDDHFSYVNNPHGEMPFPSNFGGYYTMGVGAGNILTFWMRDASFVRLKMASLAYEFDKKLISKIGLSSARIHVTGNNLAMLYNPLKDFDPEVATSTNRLTGYEGNAAYTGIAYYPLMRTFTVGIDIGF